MNPARVSVALKAALSALASGLLLSGCYYYGYPPYPSGYYAPVVPAAYAQREFTLPPGTAASGVPTASAMVPASSSPDYFADYYATPAYSSYPYPAYAYASYPYAAYPGYYGYPAYYGYGYGYPSISIGFGYWSGGGCCWGHGYGWHGGGWHGNGWHGGGGGWNGGGGNWHGGGGGGWQGGVPRSSTGMRPR